MGYYLKLNPVFLLSAAYGVGEDGCFGVSCGIIREGDTVDEALHGFLSTDTPVTEEDKLREGLAALIALWLAFRARRSEWRRRNAGKPLCPHCAGLGHAMEIGDKDTHPCECGAKPQNPHRFPVAFSFPEAGVPREVAEALALQPGVEIHAMPEERA